MFLENRGDVYYGGESTRHDVAILSLKTQIKCFSDSLSLPDTALLILRIAKAIRYLLIFADRNLP